MTEDILRRYTSLPRLLDILENKKLIWSDPNHPKYYWEDRNDRYYINEYKRDLELKGVYAICFTASDETYLQWKAYSGNEMGVCIEFDKNLLLSHFNNRAEIKSGDVCYKTESDIEKERKNGSFRTSQKPFTKQDGFSDEEEFRIIYKRPKGAKKINFVEINLDCIKGLILSPWLDVRLWKPIRESISDIKGAEHIKIRRSTILDNKRFRKQSIE